ncbi:hypothetical protein ACHWQZ_G016163 [Mnemiopsis leidyi]
MASITFDNGTEELDTELDCFLAEIDDIEQSKMEELPEEPNCIVWKECIDENTKHPYYWHTETQEVTWIKPDSYDSDLIAQETALKQWKRKCVEIKRNNETRKKAAEERKRLAESQPKPTLPRVTPRIELENDSDKISSEIPSGSFGKIGKFKFMKTEAEQKIPSAAKSSARLTFTVKKASSPAPEDPAPRDVTPPSRDVTPPITLTPAKVKVPTVTSSGRQRTVTEIAAEIKRKKQQIALTNARIHLQKRVEEQKLSKKVLENVQKKEDVKEIRSRNRDDRKVEKPASPKQENKKRRIFQEVKSKSPTKEVDKDSRRALEKEANLLKEKLEFWGGDLKKLSKFQIQIIQLETRISDFVAGHLSATYVQSKVNELGQMLRDHEENSVPKDWSCTYDREEKTYRYTNKVTGKSQLTHPGEDDGSSESESEPENDDDDLYEMFQQEISEIETKTRDKTPEVAQTCPTPSPPPAQPPALPPSSPPPPSPPMPDDAPPPVPPPPVPMQPGYYHDMWGNVVMEPWNAMGHFPGMPAAPPPPPPDDGMMETYSPGNSDTEDEEEKKKKQEDLGVVSVKAPMRYSTPPLAPGTPTKAPSPAVEEPPTSDSKDVMEAEGSLPREKREEKSTVSKKVVKKKKKADGLLIGSGSKKHKGMNSLVAKWNKVNKHADTALK